MSWIDKIQNDIVIVCPDGKDYRPAWMRASKNLNWHVSEFDFPGTDGTLVKKSNKRGNRYNIELYFRGPDHLDQSSDFEKSINDSRPLIVYHPLYGQLYVQAPSFHVDNTELNVSKWTGIIIETILEDNPKVNTDAVDSINVQKIYADELFAKAIDAPLRVADVPVIQRVNTSNFKLTIPILTIPSEVNDYYNLYNVANTAITNIITSPVRAMQTVIAMLTAPARFAIDVTTKVNLLNSQFVNLRQTVNSLFSPGPKQVYQNLAGSVISSMCLASSLPLPNDFSNNRRSIQTIEVIINAYNQYMVDLDLLQTATGGTPDSFVPNADAIIALNQLVNLAISNLILISLGTKVERSIITESDTNLIILTHRFYGLDNVDKNIEELIANNGFGLNSILKVKKNTKVVYYV